MPEGTPALVTAHHPLREAGTQGTALTRHGQKAMTELAKREVLAVLSGHVHDAFDLTQETIPECLVHIKSVLVELTQLS